MRLGWKGRKDVKAMKQEEESVKEREAEGPAACPKMAQPTGPGEAQAVDSTQASSSDPAADGAVEGSGEGSQAEGSGPLWAPELTRESYEDLLKKVEEREAFKDALLREKADFSNYQKRIARDRPQIETQAVRRFVMDLLPVMDNFERALERSDAPDGSLREGIRIVRGMLAEALSRHGIEEIEALGRPFDPSYHDAVVQEETGDHQPGTVSGILQKGYTQNGQVIRAVKVRVAKQPAEASTPSEEDGA